jgi:hypothetical protein
LSACISGVERPPMDIFLKAVDIVTERSIADQVDALPGSSQDADAPKEKA